MKLDMLLAPLASPGALPGITPLSDETDFQTEAGQARFNAFSTILNRRIESDPVPCSSTVQADGQPSPLRPEIDSGTNIGVVAEPILFDHINTQVQTSAVHESADSAVTVVSDTEDMAWQEVSPHSDDEQARISNEALEPGDKLETEFTDPVPIAAQNSIIDALTGLPLTNPQMLVPPASSGISVNDQDATPAGLNSEPFKAPPVGLDTTITAPTIPIKVQSDLTDDATHSQHLTGTTAAAILQSNTQLRASQSGTQHGAGPSISAISTLTPGMDASHENNPLGLMVETPEARARLGITAITEAESATFVQPQGKAVEFAAVAANPNQNNMPSLEIKQSNQHFSMQASSLEVELDSPLWPNALGREISAIVSPGKQQISLQLNPANLGPLMVELTVSGQEAQLQFVSHHAQVRSAVELALPFLRETLATQGINLGEAHIAGSDQDNGRNSSFDSREQDANRRGGASSNDGGMIEKEQAVQTISTQNGIPGRINLFV